MFDLLYMATLNNNFTAVELPTEEINDTKVTADTKQHRLASAMTLICADERANVK